MDIQTVINSTLILMGAGIMLFGMVRSGDIQEMMPFVPENRQETIRIYFLIHRSLMMFFWLDTSLPLQRFSCGIPYSVKLSLVSFSFSGEYLSTSVLSFNPD